MYYAVHVDLEWQSSDGQPYYCLKENEKNEKIDNEESRM
jgi:hypothetical protein